MTKHGCLRILLLVLVCGASHAEVIYTKKSLYRNISVIDRGTLVCLQFSSHRQAPSWQSCKDKRHPQRLVFDYTKMMLSGLLLDAHPHRILVAGLGGGIIPTLLHELFPDTQIDVAEIDPAVLDVAVRFFDFRQDAKLQVVISDARVYVKRQLQKGGHYDLVFLDAFTGDYIPPHLMTREFLRECRRLLTPDGVLVANTFSSSKLYDSESQTYKTVFGWFLNLKHHEGNRIILTRKGNAVTPAELRQDAARSRLLIRRYDVDIGAIASMAESKPDWDASARILTDQYAPVNLLNGAH